MQIRMVHHNVKGVGLHKTYFDCSIYKQFRKLICVPSLKWFERSKQRSSQTFTNFGVTNCTVHEDGGYGTYQMSQQVLNKHYITFYFKALVFYLLRHPLVVSIINSLGYQIAF